MNTTQPVQQNTNSKSQTHANLASTHSSPLADTYPLLAPPPPPPRCFLCLRFQLQMFVEHTFCSAFVVLDLVFVTYYSTRGQWKFQVRTDEVELCLCSEPRCHSEGPSTLESLECAFESAFECALVSLLRKRVNALSLLLH